MAASDNDSIELFDENLAKQGHLRKKQKHNRAAVETNPPSSLKVKDKPISDAGSFIIPEILCQCMQRCTERVTSQLIQRICMYFKGITDRSRQYKYLSKLIQIRDSNNTTTDKKPQTKGKHKASFRYFVPILTQADFKQQVLEKNLTNEKTELQGPISSNTVDVIKDDGKKKNVAIEQRGKIVTNGTVGNRVNEKVDNTDADKSDWDHIEVCLKAFTNVHVISDKRVILTRATQKLQTHVKCSRPFTGSGYAGISTISNGSVKQIHLSIPTAQKRPRSEETSHKIFSKKADSAAEISRLAGEWLLKQAMQSKQETSSVTLNPRTLLPEGLVLPSSVTCMPIYANRESEKCTPAQQPYLEEHHDRDLNIVSDFFSDQLWKLEYIGG